MKTPVTRQSILCVITCIITLFSASFAQAQTENWQDAGYTDTRWYDNHKDNTEYEIATAEELAGLAKLVNSGTFFEGKTIILTATQPIDLSSRYWTPIGNVDYKPFQGFFDGNGNTIAGLRVDQSRNDADVVCSGLFGFISSGKDGFTAGVKDLTLAGGEVKGGGTGNSYTGALAGLVQAYTSGESGYTIAFTGISSTVPVSGPAGGSVSYTGGLIGWGQGSGSGIFTLSGCINSGSVTGGNTTGYSYTGGLIGYGYSYGYDGGTAVVTLSGCINTGTITGGEVAGSHTGGIIGYGYGYSDDYNGAVSSVILSDSYNTGDVIASKGHTGGIAGCMVTNKYGIATGAATIRNCLSAGSVSNSDASAGSRASTGGIVGTLERVNAETNAPVVENCLAIPVSLTGKDAGYVHRIVGNNIGNRGILRNNYAYTPFGTWMDKGSDKLDGADWKLPAIGTEWTAAEPFTVWGFGAAGAPGTSWMYEPVGNYLPILNIIATALQEPRTPFRLGGEGTAEKPYIIRNRADLDLLSYEVNSGTSFAGQYLKLEPENGHTLEMGPTLFTPIGNEFNPFQGFFDGNDMTIAGLRVDNSGNDDRVVYSGLFGRITSDKDGFTTGVKDLTLEGGEVKGGGTGYSYTGALAGDVEANMSGVAGGTITITGITSTVAVSGHTDGGGSYTGGLIGRGEGYGSGTVTLSGCINAGPVTGGKVTGYSSTGGIIGSGSGIGFLTGNAALFLSGCINTGTVTGGEAPGTYTGGLIGYGLGEGFMDDGATGSFTLSDSYNRGDVIASKGRAGGIAGCMATNKFDTGTGTATIRNCLSAGSVSNTDTSTDGTASTGGIVGTLEQQDAGTPPPVVENCLAIPASLTGKPGVPLRRIVGDNIGNTGTLRNNYAHTPFGTWTDKGSDKLDGADWILPAVNSEWTAAEPFTDWAFNDQADPDKPWRYEPVDNYLPILNTINIDLQEPRIFFRLGGKGTQEKPYIIRNRADLDFLSKEVNSGTSFAGQYFKLEPENGHTLEMGSTLFTPIGNRDNRFQGFFDGNGKTIAGLCVDNSKSDVGTVYTGLFGYIYSTKYGFTAGVKDLTLEGGEVKGGGTDFSYTGALAGLVEAKTFGKDAGTIAITGITSTVPVSGPIGGSALYTGGIVGLGVGLSPGTVTLSGCVNVGSVTEGKAGDGSSTGGIIGGIVGTDKAPGKAAFSLSGCINTGTVTGGESNNSYTGGLIGTYFSNSFDGNGAAGTVILSDSYSAGDVIALKGRAGGIAGYIVTSATLNATGTVIVRNCLMYGSVSNADTSTDGSAATGGIVGALEQRDAENSAPVVENCLVISASLTGKDGVPLGRIVGENKLIDAASNLKGNYAYVPSGTWTDKGADKPDGADWDGLMTSPPVSGYDTNLWQIDATHALMPKLTAIEASLQPDVENPLSGKPTQSTFTVILPAIEGVTYDKQHDRLYTVSEGDDFTFRAVVAEGYSPISGVEASFGHEVTDNGDGTYTVKNITRDVRIYIYGVTRQYTVTVTLTLEDESLAGCVQLFPGPGTYEFSRNEEMQILAYLADACDKSDLVLIVNGETVIAEEKKPELRSTGYTFRIPIRGDTDIKIAGIERNATGIPELTPQSSEGGATVWATPGKLHIQVKGERGKVKGDGLRIYTLTGSLVDQRPLSEGITIIPLKQGVYMVVIDDEVVKVIVK